MRSVQRTEAQEKAYWEGLLKREGLTVDRGRLPRQRRLGEADSVICSKCIGFHTYEDDCGLASSE